MALNLNEQEKAYLVELLKTAHSETLHEIHHTTTNDYKDLLRRRIEVIESLQKKIDS